MFKIILIFDINLQFGNTSQIRQGQTKRRCLLWRHGTWYHSGISYFSKSLKYSVKKWKKFRQSEIVQTKILPQNFFAREKSAILIIFELFFGECRHFISHRSFIN